jgi:hypothetical protein
VLGQELLLAQGQRLGLRVQGFEHKHKLRVLPKTTSIFLLTSVFLQKSHIKM